MVVALSVVGVLLVGVAVFVGLKLNTTAAVEGGGDGGVGVGGGARGGAAAATYQNPTFRESGNPAGS